MIDWRRIPQNWRYAIPISAAFVTSVIGIYWAVLRHTPQNGGRGGAWAAIIAFASLFLRPDYGRDIYEERMKEISEECTRDSSEGVRQQIDALEQWMYINSSGLSEQSCAMAIATLIGTVFWAFGDIFASWCM